MIEIRAINDADFDVWLPLWRGYQDFYRADIPEEATRVTWTRFLDPGEPMWAALAEQEGRAVGLVHWVFHRSTWTVGPYCYLQDLFVTPDQRGAGTGRKLIEHVYAKAREAASPRVYWLTHDTNTDAMLLYDRVAERSGFVQYRKALP